jgi:signal peptidase I, archaeal type
MEDKTIEKGSILGDVIFYLGLIAMVAVVVVLSRGAGGIGGYHFYEVLTSSMESVYPQGSLVVVKNVDTDELVVEDDITFVRNIGAPITHRIVEIIENFEGTSRKAFITKGVDNAMVDKDAVLEVNVIGKVKASIPIVGGVISFLKTHLDITISVGIFLIIGSKLIKMLWRKIKRNKEERKGGEA